MDDDLEFLFTLFEMYHTRGLAGVKERLVVEGMRREDEESRHKEVMDAIMAENTGDKG